MTFRRRTRFQGLDPRAAQELIDLQSDIAADIDGLRKEAIGLTTDTKTRGTYAARYNERVRCSPVAEGLDLNFPAGTSQTQNKWIEVLKIGGGDVRVQAVSGTVQGVAVHTLTDDGFYYYQSDGDNGWWIQPGGSGGDLATVLLAGNTTGGTDIALDAGDRILIAGSGAPDIQGAAGITITAATGVNVTATTGNAVLGTNSGILLTQGSSLAAMIATAGEARVQASANIRLLTNAIERLEIESGGAWQIGGAVGAAGNVIASQGAGLPPLWTALSALGLFTSVALQVFTSSGTYTPTAGMKFCLAIGTGAGGGSGGADATSAATPGDAAAAGGGGAGGTCIELFNAATIGASQVVTIGAGGAAGANTGGNGGVGGNTTLGALFTANGGQQGNGTGTVTTNANRATGGLGGTPTGGLLNIDGGDGDDGFAVTSDDVTAANEFILGRAGRGGGSFWGAGAKGQTVCSPGNFAAVASNAGIAGRAFGSGASGALCFNTTTGVAGALGAPGVLVVLEFC
jgi:hypothetical protein